MSGGCIRAGKKFVSLRNIDLLHRYLIIQYFECSYELLQLSLLSAYQIRQRHNTQA